MKRCSKCKNFKDLLDFYRDQTAKDGHAGWCKECVLAGHKTHRHLNLEKERADDRAYYARNQEAIRVRDRKYYAQNSAKRRLSREASWARKTPEEKRAAWQAIRRNPLRKLQDAVRSVIRRALAKGPRKSPRKGRAERLLGTSFEDFKTYLESLFWPGMSWDNKAEWQIDHIVPRARFDLSNPEQQAACFNYRNQQPLWKDDNAAKYARLDWTPAESRHVLPMRLLDVEDEF